MVILDTIIYIFIITITSRIIILVVRRLILLIRHFLRANIDYMGGHFKKVFLFIDKIRIRL